MKTISRWAFGFLGALGAAPAMAGQIWVAPNGSDAAPGTKAQPLATLQKARDVAREQLRAAQRVEVILRGGTYELAAPLQLGAEDSGNGIAPALWRAADGEEVRISAGRNLTGWRPISDPAVRERLDPTVRDKVLETDLKARGIADFGEMSGGFGKGGSTGLELFLDDVPMHVSRYPNEGFIQIAEVMGATPVNIRGTKGTKEGLFRVDDKRVARWAQEKDPRVLGYWFWDWADERQKVAKLDPEKLTFELTGQHGYGYRKGQYFYGFNLLSEIDEPGEWYLDRESGKLYVLPPGTPKRAMVSLLPSAITIKNASYLTLRNLILEGARENVVTVSDSRSVQIIGCTIRNSGKWAVRIEGGQSCAVRGCEISGMGDGGVTLTGGDRKTLTPANHLVENTHIHHYSRWNRTYQAGISISGVGNRAAHNLIHDAPHQAMNFSGNDHVIEYNEVHNVCEETNDAGAIYAWNDWAARGNVVRFNYLHHIYGHKGEGANGVYLDDNFSSATIEGNIFETQQRPVHLGGGRDHQVLNNVFIDCRRALHIDARGLGWRAYGFDELKKKMEQWPYQMPPWSTRYPQLLTLLQDEPMAPKGIVVARNIMIDSAWDDVEGKAKPYVAMKDNILDGTRDLLKKTKGAPQADTNAPAVKAIGFQPIPLDKIGLYQSEERAVWPVQREVKTQPWPQAGKSGLKVHSLPPVRIARVAKAPQIDGAIAPDEYAGAPLLLAETPGRDKAQNPATARVSHDGARLYVAVTVPLKTPEKLSGKGTWGSADAIELIFRRHGQNGAPTFVLQGFADGRLVLSPDAGTPKDAMAKLQKSVVFAARTAGNAWTAEWSVPLGEAGIAFAPNLTLGFNIGARRLESDDWLVWTGTTAENWKLDGAGRVILD